MCPDHDNIRVCSLQVKMCGKTCFVTIGATSPFDDLVEAVLRPEFLDALRRHNYTHLLLQHGTEGQALFDSHAAAAKTCESGREMEITGFALDLTGLTEHMKRAKGVDGAQEGVVISHAGSGTILDGLRIGVPLIVVPNEKLLENHQVELAETLAQQEFVVYGRLDALDQALKDTERLRVRQKSWPPPNHGYMRQPKSLKNIIDEEMGYLD